MNRLTNQLGRHSVALISLTVALASLGYNTWRNEQTEANRNVRQAGMQTLLLLGELDRLTLTAYFGESERADEVTVPVMRMLGNNPRSGWAYVLTIRDLGTLLPNAGNTSAQELLSAWEANATSIAASKKAFQAVSDAVDAHRMVVLSELAMLD